MKKKDTIKCVVWDLDHTLWNGVLSEGDNVQLRPGVADIIRTLDERGILQSIASKNDHKAATAKLESFGLLQYFLHPHINWNAKSTSLSGIASALNISINSFAFVDDQPFELDEVRFTHPGVTCINATMELDGLLARPEMNPPVVTADARLRRSMYLNDMARKEAESTFQGSQEAFLATLGMTLTLHPASPENLRRAEELTVRTHQLNTTGYTYSYDELEAFSRSEAHLLLTASLDDKYGTYGKIGLSLLELRPDAWTVKLLLMSCRVMSRGVGSVIIEYLRNLARENGVRLLAEFVHTDVNRMMYMTYKFAGFRESGGQEKVLLLENDLSSVRPYPPYLRLLTPSAMAPRSPQATAAGGNTSAR